MEAIDHSFLDLKLSIKKQHFNDYFNFSVAFLGATRGAKWPICSDVFRCELARSMFSSSVRPPQRPFKLRSNFETRDFNARELALFIAVTHRKQSTKQTTKTNYEKQNKKYNPHISLYYGIKDKNLKESIVKKLPKLNRFVTIDKLCIVDVNERINKWKIIKTIKLNNEKN